MTLMTTDDLKLLFFYCLSDVCFKYVYMFCCHSEDIRFSETKYWEGNPATSDSDSDYSVLTGCYS